MNEMDLLRELRAELPAAPAEARARARGLLVAHFERAERSVPRRQGALGWLRHRFAPQHLGGSERFAWLRSRRRLLAAGAFVAVLAAAVLVLGVFSGDSRVESAVAAALHRTAAVAEGAAGPVEAAPGPGQFFYEKTEVVALEGWTPHGHVGTKDEPRTFTDKVPNVYPNAPLALVPTVVEKWISPDGTIRQRETLGAVHFLDPAAQRRWEAAGSPPPWAFDPRWQDSVRDRSGNLVKDFVTRKWAPDVSFPDPKLIPTDPKALRDALEHGRIKPPWVFDVTYVGGVSRNEQTIQSLFAILEKPTVTPAIRAAVFDALAEIPGTTLESNARDVTGRRGSQLALASNDGLQRIFVFDPKTARLLAEGETIVNPKAFMPSAPTGTPFRQVAYLASGVVDSTGETAPGAGGPVATTDPAREK